MKLLITEKPSVAMEFAKALKINMNRKDGYIESDGWIITWCVGHLVTMSYPEVYDEKLKFWRLDTLPFIPTEWKYEIIPNVQKVSNSSIVNNENMPYTGASDYIVPLMLAVLTLAIVSFVNYKKIEK